MFRNACLAHMNETVQSQKQIETKILLMSIVVGYCCGSEGWARSA